MKNLPALLGAALFLAPVAIAQPLTQDEFAKAQQYLEKTRMDVINATKRLSLEQWNFKPATNRWSIAEITEHIAAAEDLLREMVRTNVMTAPPRAGAEDIAALDAMVLEKIPDRSVKVQAPEPLQPNNRFGSPLGSVKHFLLSRNETEKFLRITDGLRAHAADSPLGKKLDAYEWLLLIGAHSERHSKQILEVKADPNFPQAVKKTGPATNAPAATGNN